MRTLFGTWASRLAGVSAIAASLLNAAAVCAQTRFEAIDFGAIRGAPALQIITIRDNALKACYLVFVTERANPSSSVTVDAQLPDIQTAVAARDERLANLLHAFDQDRSLFAGTISPNPFKYQWQADIAQQDLAWAVLGRAFGRIEQKLDRIADEARTAIAVVTQPCTPATAGGTP
jgi:hypothetical protein